MISKRYARANGELKRGHGALRSSALVWDKDFRNLAGILGRTGLPEVLPSTLVDVNNGLHNVKSSIFSRQKRRMSRRPYRARCRDSPIHACTFFSVDVRHFGHHLVQYESLMRTCCILNAPFSPLRREKRNKVSNDGLLPVCSASASFQPMSSHPRPLTETQLESLVRLPSTEAALSDESDFAVFAVVVQQQTCMKSRSRTRKLRRAVLYLYVLLTHWNL